MTSCTEEPIRDISINEELSDDQIFLMNNSGHIHNRFMDVVLKEEKLYLRKNVSRADLEKELNDLAIDFVCEQYDVEREIVINSMKFVDSLSFEQSINLIEDEGTRQVYLQIVSVLENAKNVSELHSKLNQIKEFAIENFTSNSEIIATIEIAKSSATYWINYSRDGERILNSSVDDPLTPGQREIMNADARSGAEGGIGGLIFGGPWGGVVGAASGAIIGSASKAIFG